ncbi:MAG: ABC transporter substrate-binding protein [Oscillospiraceae bacterium]
MKKYAKVLALLLALVMVFALTACGGTTSSSSSAGTSTSSNSGSSNTPVVEEPASYTYNYALSTFPTLWNIHTYETTIDAEIADYITTGFYTFDYNDTLDGYQVVPNMATEDPIDVTADYIGQYGLEEGATSQAYLLKLRDDLKWEDGSAITANDFVESAMRLLNPVAKNYRADNLYTGNLVIHNAEAYLYSGTTQQVENVINAAYTVDDLTAGEDGVYVTPDGAKVWVAVSYPLSEWLGGNTLADYVDAYGADMFDVESFEALTAQANDSGLVPLTDDNLQLLINVITFSPDWGESADDVPNYLAYDVTYDTVDWSEVGMFALSDTELVIVLDKPLSGFYLLYSLSDSWLVNIDLYDACTTVTDGVYTNTYGTSVETTMSYGPYKLTAFQADKQYTLEKNEYYFGLSDDTYQTTKIVVDYVPEAATRLELFLQGKLDTYGLTKDDMETYSLSDYCYYTPGDSTYFMAFNPDLEALENEQAAAGANINKTILTIPEFRMAMSFAMNRADFCLATSPTNGPAFALYSDLIISDPENGVAYRTTDQAKQVIANFWGVSEEYGEGKLYADIDEAIDSVTGYNLEKARQLFDQAYDAAIEQGLMTENDVVEIMVGTPNNTSSFYNNGYEYIVNNYTEAVKGTKLEGKLTFTRDDTLGNGFATALKNNTVDMLFGVGWTGSALDPYSLMEAYVSPNYQYDDCWDTTTTTMTVAIDGVNYTATIWDWNEIMNGVACTVTAEDGTTMEYVCGSDSGDPETRLDILAAIENAVLMNYDMIPLMDASTASLKGQQIQYYTEDYVFGMGRGGVKYYTYNYTDAEWDAYVASCNSELDYT